MNITPDNTTTINAELARLKTFGGGLLDLHGQNLHLSGPLVIPANVVVRGPATLSWSKDLGPGVAAISTDPGATQGAAPKLEHIDLVGPGFRSTATPVGTQLCQMDGFAPGASVHLTDCTAMQFRAGIVIRGDHNYFTRCRSNNCYFGVLFDDADGDYGNHKFDSCCLEGNLFASVGVSGANLINQSHFIQCHFGFGPYGIYKSDSGNVPSTKGFLAGVRFDGCSWEEIGNAAILDESTGAPGGQDSLFGTEISNPGFSWDDQGIYRIPTRPRDYAVSFRRIERSRIWGGCYPFLPGDKGTYFSTQYGDLDLDLGRWTGDYGQLFGSDPNNRFVGTVVVRDGFNFRAALCLNWSQGRAIKRGEPMEQGLSWYQANALGAQGNPLYGVAMHDAAPGAPLLIATQGTVQALCAPLSFCGMQLKAGPGQFVPSADGVVAMSVGNGSGLVGVTLRSV